MKTGFQLYPSWVFSGNLSLKSLQIVEKKVDICDHFQLSLRNRFRIPCCQLPTLVTQFVVNNPSGRSGGGVFKFSLVSRYSMVNKHSAFGIHYYFLPQLFNYYSWLSTMNPIPNPNQLEPYQLEPEYTDDELQELGLLEPELAENNNVEMRRQDPDQRLGNTRWCQCDGCSTMPTVVESLCCTEETANLLQKLHEGYIDCIIDHEDFESVCLNMAVLEMLMHCLREVRGYGRQMDWENK